MKLHTCSFAQAIETLNDKNTNCQLLLFIAKQIGEQVYALGIPKPLAPPPDSRCRGLSRWSPSNQIKETSMIKTEYKKVVVQPRA